MLTSKVNLKDPEVKDLCEPPRAFHLVIDYISRRPLRYKDVARGEFDCDATRALKDYDEMMAAGSKEPMDFAKYCRRRNDAMLAPASDQQPDDTVAMCFSFLSVFVFNLQPRLLDAVQDVRPPSADTATNAVLSLDAAARHSVCHLVKIMMIVVSATGKSVEEVAELFRTRCPLSADAEKEKSKHLAGVYVALMNSWQVFADAGYSCVQCRRLPWQFGISFSARAGITGIHVPPIVHTVLSLIRNRHLTSRNVFGELADEVSLEHWKDVYETLGPDEFASRLEAWQSVPQALLTNLLRRLLLDTCPIFSCYSIPEVKRQLTADSVSHLADAEKYILGHVLRICRELAASSESPKMVENVANLLCHDIGRAHPTEMVLLIGKSHRFMQHALRDKAFLAEFSRCQHCDDD